MQMLFLAGVACAALALPAMSAPAQQPVNPATGGSAQQPGHKQMGLLPNQASLARTLGLMVRSDQGALLGHIFDAAIDRQHGTTLLALHLNGSGARILVSWADLTTVAGSPDNLKLTMAPAALTQAPSFTATLQQHADYLDAKKNLLGRPATSRTGASLGTISDLVVKRADGRIEDVLIRSGGLGEGNAPQAVPWKTVAQLPKSNSKPIAFAIDPQQLAEAPFFTLKAPLRPQAPNPNQVMEKVPPTGNTGTSGAPSGR